MDSWLDVGSFMPHGMCFQWQPQILWPTVISDVVIALAYFAFMMATAVFVFKRKDLKYKSFFLLSGSLIFLACGTSHFLSAVVIWYPIYQVAAVVKIITALSSVAAATLIWMLIPVFLKLPSNSQLEEKNAELTFALNQLRQAKNDAIQSEKLASLGPVVAGVAHELNTPLGTCITATSVAQDWLKSEKFSQFKLIKEFSDIKDALAMVSNNLITCRDLINNFKEIAAGDFSIGKRKFKVEELMTTILDSFHSKFERHSHKFELNCPSDIVVEENTSPIIRILTNLIDNSLEHGFEKNESGNMELKVFKLDDETLALEYSDNGKGMTNEQLNKVFEPFYKHKVDSGGSGLGMTIVHNTVMKLGGQVSYESNRIKGICVYLTLPVKFVLAEEDASEEVMF